MGVLLGLASVVVEEIPSLFPVYPRLEFREEESFENFSCVAFGFTVSLRFAATLEGALLSASSSNLSSGQPFRALYPVTRFSAD